MARFHFSLGGYQLQVTTAAVVSMRTLRALSLTDDDERNGAALAAEVEAPLKGPGWFDSSWDLVSGLEVREGLPGDARLNEWLSVCLRA